MKIALAAGAVVGSITLVVIIAMSMNQASDQPTTDTPATVVSSSTQKTDSEANDTETDDAKPAEKSAVASAVYTDFTDKSFQSRSGSTRILFFYDDAHSPSVKVHEMLTAHTSQIPEDTYVYRLQFAEYEELAARFGVTSPGASLKFDSNDQLSGVYIATDTPTIETYKQILLLK